MSEMSQMGMARAIMGGASRYKGHIIITSAPMEPRGSGKGNVLSGLCGPFPDHVALGLGGRDDGQAGPCAACEVMEHVFGANMPYAWSRRVPFFVGGVFTRAVRYWLLSLMGHVEDSEIFGRWQAAKTFEYLNSQMQKNPSNVTDDYNVGAFPCCHYCGAEAKHGFPGSVCGVCEGRVLTRPALSITSVAHHGSFGR